MLLAASGTCQNDPPAAVSYYSAPRAQSETRSKENQGRLAKALHVDAPVYHGLHDTVAPPVRKGGRREHGACLAPPASASCPSCASQVQLNPEGATSPWQRRRGKRCRQRGTTSTSAITKARVETGNEPRKQNTSRVWAAEIEVTRHTPLAMSGTARMTPLPQIHTTPRHDEHGLRRFPWRTGVVSPQQ